MPVLRREDLGREDQAHRGRAQGSDDDDDAEAAGLLASPHAALPPATEGSEGAEEEANGVLGSAH